jgi:serine/threonine-protein kinase HipA
LARKSAKFEALVVLLQGRTLGRVSRDGRLRFYYHADYLRTGPGIPLSLSMPLLQEEHSHDVIHTYMWGLLPDNEQVLRRWAAKYHVSPANAFGLLSHVGEDCASAVQFVPEDRLRPGRRARPDIAQ